MDISCLLPPFIQLLFKPSLFRADPCFKPPSSSFPKDPHEENPSGSSWAFLVCSISHHQDRGLQLIFSCWATNSLLEITLVWVLFAALVDVGCWRSPPCLQHKPCDTTWDGSHQEVPLLWLKAIVFMIEPLVHPVVNQSL